MSTSVTHIIVKPPLKKDKSFPYSILYYAVVSGAHLLQQSWLSSLKDGTASESEHEFPPEDDGLYTTKFKEILAMRKTFRQSYGGEGFSIFSSKAFTSVLVLCSSRSQYGKQRKAAIHSLIKAGGGSIAVDDCWRLIKEKPRKAANLVSMVIIANGENLVVHDINISFIKQLLMLRVPTLYEEILCQIIQNEVVADAEVMITHSLYYWCNEHPEKLEFSDEEIQQIWRSQIQSGDHDSEMNLVNNSKKWREISVLSSKTESYPSEVFNTDYETDLLEDMEMEIEANNRRAQAEFVAKTSDEEQQLELVVKGRQEAGEPSVDDDGGPFEIIDLDIAKNFNETVEVMKSWSEGMSALSYSVPKALAWSGVESASLPEDLRQYFSSIIVELAHNLPTSFIHDFICFEAVNSIKNSLHPSLLPTPEILSLLFHNVAKPEFGQQFDVGNAVYRLLMFFLHKFPPCNAEGRFYWFQVLTNESPTVDDSICNERHGLYMTGNSLLLRVADFRKMILETFTFDGRNHNLMELLLSILEADLFNIEGCDGLNNSQEIIADKDESNRSSHSLSCDKVAILLEQSQNSSILDGFPLSLLIIYDPIERRKRGLDKAAMETCFAIVNTALDSHSVISSNLCWRLLAVVLEGLRFFLSERLKLFRGNQISIDLQLDIERLGRYLFKRGLSVEEIGQLVRVDWIYSTISAMN